MEICNTCQCDDFLAHVWKKTTCNNCFHIHTDPTPNKEVNVLDDTLPVNQPSSNRKKIFNRSQTTGPPQSNGRGLKRFNSKKLNLPPGGTIVRTHSKRKRRLPLPPTQGFAKQNGNTNVHISPREANSDIPPRPNDLPPQIPNRQDEAPPMPNDLPPPIPTRQDEAPPRPDDLPPPLPADGSPNRPPPVVPAEDSHTAPKDIPPQIPNVQDEAPPRPSDLPPQLPTRQDEAPPRPDDLPPSLPVVEPPNHPPPQVPGGGYPTPDDDFYNPDNESPKRPSFPPQPHNENIAPGRPELPPIPNNIPPERPNLPPQPHNENIAPGRPELPPSNAPERPSIPPPTSNGSSEATHPEISSHPPPENDSQNSDAPPRPNTVPPAQDDAPPRPNIGLNDTIGKRSTFSDFEGFNLGNQRDSGVFVSGGIQNNNRKKRSKSRSKRSTLSFKKKKKDSLLEESICLTRLLSISEDQFKEAFPTPDISIEFKTQRDRVAFEILSTEMSYGKSILICRELHKNVLSTASETGFITLTDIDIRELFGTISEISGVSMLFQENLIKKFSDWSDQQIIGDLFIEIAPFLAVYKSYTAGYGNAIKNLSTFSSKDKQFDFLLEQLLEHPLCKQKGLSSFLIMPVQRIPRYVLLLMDLIKATDENHPDYPLLKSALDIIKHQADAIDEAVFEAENAIKLLEIQRQFGNSKAIVVPHRKFVYQGDIVKQCRKDRKVRRFWIFNDILMYGFQTTTNSSKYTISREMDLSDIAIQDIQDNESTNTINCLKISEPSKSFLVFFNSPSEKLDFYEMLNTTVNALIKKNRIRGIHRNGTVAPTWTPDKQVKNCELCNKKFTSVKRKHHCRKCGKCVCQSCSDFKMIIPEINEKKKKRVCEICFNDS
eukprot:TRINITY_DN1529_c0_g1_i1.p1 TRINITY_DN1529_c0_g1~~TRINITY_DN1529_c0_g1_i1.p1  ORF type:complete len:895 (-),score=222.87 TRINITY_DN1529_c0_g1_i1:23-2671(-)